MGLFPITIIMAEHKHVSNISYSMKVKLIFHYLENGTTETFD